jgi:hypothetical protein
VCVLCSVHCVLCYSQLQSRHSVAMVKDQFSSDAACCVARETLRSNFKGNIEKFCVRCSPTVNRWHTHTETVRFPADLKYFVILIDPFYQSGANQQTSRSTKQLLKFNASHCRLFGQAFEVSAVIVHEGGQSPKSGHYKTKVRNGRKWVWLDDAKDIGLLASQKISCRT